MCEECKEIKNGVEEPFKIITDQFQKCQLGKLLGRHTNEFKIEIGKRFVDNKRDITIIGRKTIKDKKEINRKFYKYHCNKCGFECGEHYKNEEYHEELWIEESNLLKENGNGCSCCCSSPQIVVQGINDIPTTAPEMIKYFQGGIEEAKLYTAQSNKKIYPICPDCGKLNSKAIKICNLYHQGFNCVFCSDGMSYPNKFCFNLLEQSGVKFETEYSPEWIKPKRYDFYFEKNDNKYIIEMDGNLGHGNTDNLMNGQTKKESKNIDNYKDLKAREYGIEVIRINSKQSELEYIRNNITNSKLNSIFDLSNVDWLKCEEFALSNLVKQACELKRDNPDFTTIDIGKIMKLHYSTIIKYLKKGSKLEWVNYNPKEENLKGSSKSGKISGKPIEIFRDGKSLGKFESCHELERQSEEKFGVKLYSSLISKVCSGERNHHKGFIFKYID